jgi:hypothetical protein
VRLSDAANHFHSNACADAYGGSSTFKCQFTLFNDVLRDGLTVERRIMELAPSVILPTRRTMTTVEDGKVWIVGDDQPDYFGGYVIRSKFVVQLAEGVATVRTAAQALAGAGGFTAYASRSWIKANHEAGTSSLIANEYNIYFSRTEPLVEGTLVSLGGRWHMVRSVFPSLAGYLVALADELPEPVVTTASYTHRTYVPATDAYTTVVTTIAALRLRWQEHYRYVTHDVEKYRPGDVVLLVLKSAATPATNDLFTVASQNYTVDAVLDEGLCWALHLRHV